MKAHTSITQANVSPQKALELLQEGNERFISNLKVNRNLLQQANETREGQWPFAVILSCIDSRTSAELIFDQGLGDIFSVRIAGNIVNTDIIGSLEFACKVAGSKLIVVLGHTNCGAVKAACDHVEIGSITELLSKIQPAIYQETETLNHAQRNSSNKDFVQNVTRNNIHVSVKAIINRSIILDQMIRSGEIAIIGAIHDLSTGRVQFYEDTLVDQKKLLSQSASSNSTPHSKETVTADAHS
ncbi:MAG: carbonic anhydrase [Flavobacteriales bacterium]|nr:carbonic anhydrase [Flavobacteriales bacterium]